MFYFQRIYFFGGNHMSDDKIGNKTGSEGLSETDKGYYEDLYNDLPKEVVDILMQTHPLMGKNDDLEATAYRARRPQRREDVEEVKEARMQQVGNEINEVSRAPQQEGDPTRYVSRRARNAESAHTSAPKGNTMNQDDYDDGIQYGLYGVSPIDNSIINNVSTLKTTILQIRDVPQEDTVGYSRKGHLTRNSRIAALPIGYADGLNRHLGNGHAYCLVNGQRAPYVGNICMDVCMIDVTDIDCKEGDAVEIFGDHLSITVLSDILETIPYEVLTSISTRVKRIYYQD